MTHLPPRSHSHGKPARAHLPLWLVLCLFSSIAVFLLWTPRMLSALPYLLLLACPVLHLLLHRRHRHGPHHDGAAGPPD